MLVQAALHHQAMVTQTTFFDNENSNNEKITVFSWNIRQFLGIGMHAEVRDPEDKEILSRVYSAEGEFDTFRPLWHSDWNEKIAFFAVNLIHFALNSHIALIHS